MRRQLTRSGGSIGAGLFVGSGSAFHNGGPGSVVRILGKLVAENAILILLAVDRFHGSRCHVAFHGTSAWRTRGPVSSQWRIFHIRMPLSGRILVRKCDN